MSSSANTEASSPVFDTRDELPAQDVDSLSDLAPDSSVCNDGDDEGNDPGYKPNRAGPTSGDVACTRGRVSKKLAKDVPPPNYLVGGHPNGHANPHQLVEQPDQPEQPQQPQQPGPDEVVADIQVPNELPALRAAGVLPPLPAPRTSGKLAQGPDLLPTRPPTPISQPPDTA